MISQLNTVKTTDRLVVATRTLGVSVMDAGMPGAGLSRTASLLPVLPARVRSERPTQAPAVAAAEAQAQSAYAFAAAADGAGTGTAGGAERANEQINGRQKTTQHGKWAFRGLEPWSDPA